MKTAHERMMAGILGIAVLGMGISAGGEPSGPIEYPGMKTVVDGQGVQAPEYVFRNDARKTEPWQAQWITGNGWFRKEVTLDAAPAKVWELESDLLPAVASPVVADGLIFQRTWLPASLTTTEPLSSRAMPCS